MVWVLLLETDDGSSEKEPTREMGRGLGSGADSRMMTSVFAMLVPAD